VAKLRFAILLSISSFLIDQVTKAIVVTQIPLHSSVSILGNTVRFTHIRNPMAAWGLPIGGTLSLIVLPVAIGMVVLIYRLRARTLTERIALSIILGGAVGNLIDRIRWGNVVDFIDIGVGNLRWPVFNMADAFVTIGMFLMIYTILKKRR
jgi:signal peptidase II